MTRTLGVGGLPGEGARSPPGVHRQPQTPGGTDGRRGHDGESGQAAVPGPSGATPGRWPDGHSQGPCGTRAWPDAALHALLRPGWRRQSLIPVAGPPPLQVDARVGGRWTGEQGRCLGAAPGLRQLSKAQVGTGPAMPSAPVSPGLTPPPLPFLFQLLPPPVGSHQGPAC